MKIIFSLFILLNLLINSTFGQVGNFILTKEQNNKWLDSVKLLSLDNQLEAIKNRLLKDTFVYVQQKYNDRIRVVENIGNKKIGECRPTLIIGGYPMIIENKTKSSKIIQLTKILDKTHIKEIQILSGNDPAMSAIYGNIALDGIIVMSLTKKKYVRKFKKLKLNY
jgi:hypothetical protein